MRLLLSALVLAAVTAGPALAADQLVPASAAGQLESYRGKPWWEPMLFCAAIYMVEADKAAEAGETAKVDPARTRAAGFFASAATRVSEDQGKSFDEAMVFLRGGLTSRMMAVTYSWHTPAQFEGSHKACAEMEAGYEKAF
jgi:hypothetical protein